MYYSKEMLERRIQLHIKDIHDPKEIALIEKMIEFVFDSSRRCAIFHYMDKRNIKSISDFMSIEFDRTRTRWYNYSPADQHGSVPPNVGWITCNEITKIQKSLIEESDKRLFKVPIVKYEWRLI